MEASQTRKFDFRFADEEDAAEIAALVNDAHKREEVGKGGEDPFLSEPKIDVEKLRIELNNARDLKWLVLENPMPDETMVAAVAVKLNCGPSATRAGSLRCLSVLPSSQGCAIGSNLLRREESVCRGLGCTEVRLDIMMRRPRLKRWFETQGYKSVGGGSWMGDTYVGNAVPYVTLAKDLRNQGPESSSQESKGGNAGATAPPPDALLSFTAELAEAFRDLPAATPQVAAPPPAAPPPLVPSPNGSVQTGSASVDSAGRSERHSGASESSPGLHAAPGDETLEGLLGVLVSQLGTPSGREQFNGLVAAQDANVLGERLDPAMSDFGAAELEVVKIGSESSRGASK